MRIVVIDDEQDVVDLINYYFSQKGAKVFPYTESEDGLRAVKTLNPDVVIIDYQMPNIDGEELLRRLKNDSKSANIPVIMFSCMTDFEKISHLFAKGLADYLVKPLNMRKLYDIVMDHYEVEKASA